MENDKPPAIVEQVKCNDLFNGNPMLQYVTIDDFIWVMPIDCVNHPEECKDKKIPIKLIGWSELND